MTGVLEDTFGVKMVSHRAGRWSFNVVYAQILIEQGYRVDCSVTPHISWATDRGDPRGKGGTDFSHFPETAYFLDPEDISLPGNSPLLEVPVTIIRFRYPRPVAILKELLRRNRYVERVARRLFPPYAWLRPKGRDRSMLIAVLSAARQEQRDYVEFMLHSSELMPGGSPRFPSAHSIETFTRTWKRCSKPRARSSGLGLCQSITTSLPPLCALGLRRGARGASRPDQSIPHTPSDTSHDRATSSASW